MNDRVGASDGITGSDTGSESAQYRFHACGDGGGTLMGQDACPIVTCDQP